MSHFSVRGEQSTSSEIVALTNLVALATSGAGEFIQKTGATTFANATPGASGLATTALDNLASVAINAALVLGTSGAFALGSATKMWAGLYLASGAVINFNNGNATLTHSAGLITSNVPVSLGTSNALTAGSIELGHASDTTITRASAGVAAVEGKNIYVVGGADVAVTDGGTGVSAITALSIWVANSANTITEVTPGAGNSIRINAGGTAWEAFTPSASVPTTITITDEATDTSCFPLFVTAATGDLGPKSNAGLTFNSNTGVLAATGFSGPLTGNVTGNVSGTAATVTGAAQAAITSVGTLTSLASGAITSTGLLTVTAAGNTARFVNSTDGASVQVAKFEGDRATMADADEAYISLLLSDDGGTQTEFARMTWIADDVNVGTSVDATLKFSVAIAGSLTAKLSLTGSALTPAASDGTALGTGSLMWSDLFLASGGVININNGAATLTHSANLLTLGGSGAVTLALGTNSLTMTGSIAATGSRVTKGWFTDLESTNMPTVGGTAILTSLTAPQFTTIELGAASDTTIARVSAGVISVEGATVATLSAAQTWTGQNKFNNLIDVNNAIAASGNAATVPVTYRLNTVTNNSAATLTITMTTTSAVDGQMTVVRILDASAAAQTITWVNTENSTVSAPTTSNGSTTLPLTVGFMYNGATSKWRCIASA